MFLLLGFLDWIRVLFLICCHRALSCVPFNRSAFEGCMQVLLGCGCVLVMHGQHKGALDSSQSEHPAVARLP